MAGVLVLDGLLHYDSFPNTQTVPENFEEFFPGAYEELRQHNHMGDFIQIVRRAGMDETVAHRLVPHFQKQFSLQFCCFVCPLFSPAIE